MKRFMVALVLVLLLAIQSFAARIDYFDDINAGTATVGAGNFSSVGVGATGTLTEETNTLTFDDGDGAPITLQTIRDKEPPQTPVSQAEAEAGTEATIRSWSPVRVLQAFTAYLLDGLPAIFSNVTIGTTYRGATRAGIDAAITAGAKSIELTGDITLAAHWDLSAFTGRFSTNGHQISGAFTFTAPAGFVGSDNCLGSTLTFVPSQYMTGPLRPVWWGADPTGATDSTAALQAAFTAAGTAGYDGTSGNQFPSASYGMRVDLGTGVYKVNDTLTVTGCGVSIEGDSWGGTYIWYTGGTLTTTDYVLKVGVTPTAEATHIRPFRLKNITIRTDDDSTYGATSPRGLWMNDVHDWVIEGCNFFYLYKGFYFADAWTGEFKNSKIFACYSPSQFYSAVNAVKMDGVIFADHGGGTASASIKCQLELRLCEDVTFINCDFSGGETNALAANVILVNLNRAINFFGNYFERNAAVRPVYAVNATPTAAIPNTGTEGLNFIGNHLRSMSVTSIRSATYKWTASGSGTGEFYLELAAGGDPGTGQPYYVQTNDTARVKGTLGSLAASTWGWGDNDSLGYNTIYVRLADDSDPDSAAADYVEMVAGDIAAIYARILVQGKSYHRGWNISGNECYLDPTKYLVETSSTSQILQDSLIDYNTIVTGMGNIAPTALTTAGFNSPRVEKVTKVISGTVANTKQAIEFIDTFGNILANVGASYNATVSTSPVNIALISDMALVTVSGVKSDDTSKKFTETITCIKGVAACSTAANVVETGTPATRTYAMSSSALTLGMGSDTYKVVTVVHALKPTNIP